MKTPEPNWQLGSQRLSILETSRQRLLVVMVCFMLAFSAIIFRLLDLSLFSGSITVQEALYEEPALFGRREIVDRNGELLATNLDTASLYANPRVMLDIDEALTKLTTVLPDIGRETLKERLSKDTYFVWIKRNLTPAEQYAINALGIPGLYFTTEERRIYPQGSLFSHALGYVDVDGNGLAGMERGIEDTLKVAVTEADNASPLITSLDVRVQHVVREALQEQVDHFHAKGASGLVMDANSGEMLAMVSLPDFDPHNPGEANANQKFNRATLGVYEMGSTFKTFTMALGFEQGKTKLHKEYDVSEPLRIANFTINDFHPHEGVLSIPEIFMQSSNIGTARILMDVGEEKQRPFLKKLGMCAPVDLEVAERGTPLCPERWGKVNALTISYGHGIAVTPLHVIRGTAAMVNGGTLYSPTLLKHDNGQPLTAETVIGQETSNTIRKLMRLVVTYGTGGYANARGYLVGGKTGSADKPVNGSYHSGATITSFVGAFPMHDPKYVVFALLDEPKTDTIRGLRPTGGTSAAPAVRNIIAKIAPMLGVTPILEETLDIRTDLWIDQDNYAPRPPAPKTISF